MRIKHIKEQGFKNLAPLLLDSQPNKLKNLISNKKRNGAVARNLIVSSLPLYGYGFGLPTVIPEDLNGDRLIGMQYDLRFFRDAAARCAQQ